METIKKVFKFVAIIAAIAAVVAGVVVVIKKISEKNCAYDSEENYVSCSCCEVPAK